MRLILLIMENLLLKHLAPYLPYELKFKDLPKGYEKERVLSIRNIEWCLTNGKPILRPLSDLTKEIEVNGEKLKVCDILQAKLNYGFAGIYPTTEKQIMEKIRTSTLFYSDAVKLFKYHFDVFDLIKSGLAIDINTI